MRWCAAISDAGTPAESIRRISITASPPNAGDAARARSHPGMLSLRPPPSFSLPRATFLVERQVVVVDALSLEHLEPWSAVHVFAAVLVPADIELRLLVVTQNLRRHEGADIQAYTVVHVWAPTNRLFGQ